MGGYRKGAEVAFDKMEPGKTYFDKSGSLFDFVARSKRDEDWGLADYHGPDGAMILGPGDAPLHEALPAPVTHERWLVWWREGYGDTHAYQRLSEADAERERDRLEGNGATILGVQHITFEAPHD